MDNPKKKKEDKTRVRIARVVGSFLSHFYIAFIALVAFYVSPLAALFVVPLFKSYARVAMGTRLGLELDPMYILQALIANWWISREVKWKNNKITIMIWVVNFAFSFLAAACAAWIFTAIFPGGMPLALLPQNVLGIGIGWAFFLQLILSLFVYTLFLMTTLYTRDAYGAFVMRGFGELGIGFVNFFINRETIDFGITFAFWIAGSSFGTHWWVIFFGQLGAAALALLIYWALFEPVSNVTAKLGNSRGDAVENNAVVAVIDDTPPCDTGRRGGKTNSGAPLLESHIRGL